MSDFRVASRYAKSIIELAEEKGILEQVREDMALFNDTLSNSRDLTLLLRSPIVSHAHKSEILRKLFSDKVTELTSKFFEIICRKNREAVLPSIAVQFLRQYNDLKGIVSAKITTVAALTEGAKSKVIDSVKQITGANEVELEEVLDDSIIGGYVLHIGDRQIDDSVKGRLEDLRASLA